jgi:hypothetical protein
MPDSIHQGRLWDAFFSGTIFCLPLVVLGRFIKKHIVSNSVDSKNALITPKAMALLGAWLPNFIIIGLIDLLAALQIIFSGEPLGESGLMYFAVFGAWQLGVVLAIAGGVVGLIIKKRSTFADNQ